VTEKKDTTKTSLESSAQLGDDNSPYKDRFVHEPKKVTKPGFGKSSWEKPAAVAFVILFTAVGSLLLLNSFANTTSSTKVWDSDTDWSTGVKSNVSVANGSVSLALNATTSTNPYTCPSMPVLQTGSKGDCVKRIQWYLNSFINAKLKIDGSFGTNTRYAVRNYQKANGLAVDGVVGPSTWASLEAKASSSQSATKYKTSGTLTLGYDAGSSSDWTSLTPLANLPNGTNITYRIRTSSDNSNWSVWSSNIASVANSRFIQIQATLTTSNTSFTPTLNTLTLGYDLNIVTTPPPTGTCSGVAMTQGQADIDAHPAGTTYCISGEHLNWTLIPKTGDKIIGDGTAVLDGTNTTTWAIYVFNRDADNVEIANLEIKNYLVEGQRGAILSSNNGESTGWILRNLQVHDNGTSAGGAGASLGPNWQVLGGRYYNNRQSGLARGDSGVVVDGVELDHNNFTDNSYTARNIDCGFEGGGFKWAALDGIVIKNSRIHHNACRGLWADGSGNNSTITNNQIHDNWAEGIMIEISTGSTITGNTLYGNGFQGCSPFGWGAAIIIPASDKVTIANNNIYGNCHGVIGLQQSRPDGNPGLLQDLMVRDNTISGPGGKTGAVTDNGTDLTTRNLQFINNTYSNGMTFCNLKC